MRRSPHVNLTFHPLLFLLHSWEPEIIPAPLSSNQQKVRFTHNHVTSWSKHPLLLQYWELRCHLFHSLIAQETTILFKSLQKLCWIYNHIHPGTFLSDYTNKSNLHIAVTDSVGEVVEFDKSGVRRDRSRAWEQCLVVSLADHDLGVAEMMGDPDWSEYWDMCLEQTLTTDQWSETRYHEDNNNCFTFVLTFLRTLNQRPFTGELIQRTVEIGSLTEK